MKTITGKDLNKRWFVNAQHALAHKDGDWYHYLEKFPGALFDSKGYVLFNSNKDYLTCNHFIFGEEVHVPGGISKIPGYIKKAH